MMGHPCVVLMSCQILVTNLVFFFLGLFLLESIIDEK